MGSDPEHDIRVNWAVLHFGDDTPPMLLCARSDEHAVEALIDMTTPRQRPDSQSPEKG